MNDLIISQDKIPARLRNRTRDVANPFSNMASTGFPVISIKSKVFAIVHGGERELILKHGTDEPATNLEVVVIDYNPARSKVYYAKGYTEGDASKPTCYSNDGVSPGADSESPQSKKCEICPHNQWGSKITENNKKAKACNDTVRLAVTPAGSLDKPMLLRIPATSIVGFGTYGTKLFEHGVEPRDVVTKVGFDYSVSHPALTFDMVRFTTDEEAAQIDETIESDMVSNITGTNADAGFGDEAAATDAGAPVKDEKLVAAEEKAAEAPKAKVAVEEDAPEPEAPKATVQIEDADDIDKALADLDFDD